MAVKPWYQTTTQLKGPLVVLEKVADVGYGEICNIKTETSQSLGQVLEVGKDHVVVQLFSSTLGMNRKAKVQFTGKPATLGVSEKMLGKTFDGLGRCTSGTYSPVKHMDVHGSAINPASREHPSKFVQTGISVIDQMITLVEGQKLPIFTSAGLPHNQLAAQIVRQAKFATDKFVVIFAAMGITREEAYFFTDEFKKTGALKNAIVFMNTASDPSVERILTPRVALTTAEYFAFELGYKVVVVMTDFTNYCETLRELSSARNEVPGRRGYPGYMYTDLASHYERAGTIKGLKGSITQIPILSMPSGDKTHPVPDLTGYITEGQIVLDGALFKKGVTPPINPLPSLSRLKIGSSERREDHYALSDQLYAIYAQALEIRQLVSVVGESSLSDADRSYLRFAERFEMQYLNQKDENRSIEKTRDLGWNLLTLIPKQELKKVSDALIEKYLK